MNFCHRREHSYGIKKEPTLGRGSDFYVEFLSAVGTAFVARPLFVLVVTKAALRIWFNRAVNQFSTLDAKSRMAFFVPDE